MPLPFSDVKAFRRDPLTLVLKRAHEHEPGFVPLYLGLKPIWLVTEPELTRKVLTWDPEELDKGKIAQTIRPLVKESLLTNAGASHKRTKAAIQPHVRRNVIAGHLGQLSAIINGFSANVAQLGEVDTETMLAPLALQMASMSIFGNDVISKADQMVLVEAVKIVEAEIAADIFRAPWIPRLPQVATKQADRIGYAHEIVSMVVNRARKSDHRSHIIRSMEAAGISDTNIDNEILGLLIAGHHTSAATLGWIIYHLAIDPSIAEMIALEADAVLPAAERNDVQVLRCAELSDAFVKEILRLYPAGWWTSREVLEPLTIGSKDFVVGDNIMVSPWQIHRDKRYWVEPDELELGRDFSGPAYIPFGVGPRACIGMNMGLIGLHLLTLQLASSFSFSLPHHVEQPLRPVPSVTLLFPPTVFGAQARVETDFRYQAA